MKRTFVHPRLSKHGLRNYSQDWFCSVDYSNSCRLCFLVDGLTRMISYQGIDILKFNLDIVFSPSEFNSVTKTPNRVKVRFFEDGATLYFNSTFTF